MSRIIKKLFKCFVVYIVLFVLILANVSYGYSVAEISDAIAGYALNVLTWGNDENLPDGGPRLRYNQCGTVNGVKGREYHPKYGGTQPELPWYFDCSSFASNMYDMVTANAVFGGTEHACSGLLGSSALESTGVANTGSTPPSSVLPGYMLLADGHVEIYLGPEYGTGGAHSNHANGDVNAFTTAQEQVDCAAENRGFISYSPAAGTFYKLKDSTASKVTTLDTTFAMGNVRGTTVNYSNFFFNGVPDGKYSLASRSIWDLIIDTLLQILDYILGLLLYIIRMVIVGFTSIVENIVNWFINSVADTHTEAVELNMSSTETSTSNYETKVTVDTILFNKLELFDINIFKVR